MIIQDMNNFSKQWNLVFSGKLLNGKINLTPYKKLLMNLSTIVNICH